RAGGHARMLLHHAVPGGLVAVLEVQPLAIGAIAQDHRMAAGLDRAKNVAAQHQPVVCLDRHVPVDPHPRAGLAPLPLAHACCLARFLGMTGSSRCAWRSGPACSVTLPPNTDGGRSRGSLWTNGPTPVHTLPSVSTPSPGSPGKT